MLGSAFVTTRLSSTTMKRATETIAKVHRWRGRDESACSCDGSLTIGREYSLTSAGCQGRGAEPPSACADFVRGLAPHKVRTKSAGPGNFDRVLGWGVAGDHVLGRLGLGEVAQQVGLA